MLGVLVLVGTLLCLGFLALCVHELGRRRTFHDELGGRLMTYDEQLRVLRLLRQTRATLEDVLDPLLEPELADVRILVSDLDEALEMYYKS